MYNDIDADQFPGNEIRLLLGSDHALLRELLKLQFIQIADIELIASTGLGSSLLDLVTKSQPDVLLLTPRFGSLDSHEMDLIKTAVAENPRSRVITLSAGYLPGQVVLLSEYGVAGLLLESQDWSTLVRAIRSVHQGAFFATPSVLRSVTGINLARQQSISSADACLLELVSGGLSNQEIGRRLNIAESTVRSRLSNVLIKLEAANRTHAVAIAHRKGYLPVPATNRETSA